MDIKLFDSELKVMDVLWKQGDTPAREIARALGEELGWNVNTTYTLIKRCMKKGAIERSEPGFFCHALIPKSAVCGQDIQCRKRGIVTVLHIPAGPQEHGSVSVVAK